MFYRVLFTYCIVGLTYIAMIILMHLRHYSHPAVVHTFAAECRHLASKAYTHQSVALSVIFFWLKHEFCTLQATNAADVYECMVACLPKNKAQERDNVDNFC